MALPNCGLLSPISIARSRRARANWVLARSRSTRKRSAATCALSVSAGEEAPSWTRLCSNGMSGSKLAICSSKISMRRCRLMMVMNAIAVSDSTSSRVARRCQTAAPMPASPAAIRASRLPPEFDELAELQIGLGRSEALVRSRPERIVEFERYLRIGKHAGLNSEAARDADIALGRGQPRIRRQRALERLRQRDGARRTFGSLDWNCKDKQCARQAQSRFKRMHSTNPKRERRRAAVPRAATVFRSGAWGAGYQAAADFRAAISEC